MSTNNATINILPPQRGDEETFVVQNHRCPDCNGRGYLITTEKGETVHTGCLRCDSTGRLRAKVFIEWQPDCD
jgi:DnaJ-class molecular chaperone